MASGAPGIHGPDVEPFDLKKHELKKPGDLPHIYAMHGGQIGEERAKKHPHLERGR